MSELYFPGRDYPDRQVWLAKRCTPPSLFKRRGIMFWQGILGVDRKERGQTFAIGFNEAKRVARLDPAVNPISGKSVAHQTLIQLRHAARRNYA